MKKAIFITTLLIVAGAGLYFFGGTAYRHYREKRLLSQAKQFLAKGDLANALLCARQTLHTNPGNIAAHGIMADLAERMGSPASLDCRRRLAELAPTTENKLRLARAALRIQSPPFPLARQILDDLEGPAKDITAYHLVAAELALRCRDFPDAEVQFLEASRLEPANQLHKLNLAVLRLQSTNSDVSADACATLEGLRSNPNLAPIALRWLIAGRLGGRELAAAERLSRELVGGPRSTMEDRLQYLNILDASRKPELEDYLAALQCGSVTNASEVYSLSAWMIAHQRLKSALQWLTNCPVKLRAEQPVPLALVNCYVAKKDWRALEAFLTSEKWSDLEFMRLAFLSRAASEQNATLAAEALWRQAVRQAADQLGPLTTLLGLAANWDRQQAREDLLWRITQRFPRQRWACQELGRLYQSTGNTWGLNKICALMVSHYPNDLFAQNNLATTSLLLKQGLPKAHELAKNIYQLRPDEPTIVSTYAYSLHVQGRTKAGLDAFETLKPHELEQPSIALYYSALLSANGDTNRAEKFLEFAKANAASFLPEERALMQP